jgi:hypothetical protein
MGDVSGTESFRLGACAKSLTEALILYSNGTTLYRRRLSGGSWEAATAWSNSLATITGVACCHPADVDWNIIITGTQVTTLKPGVWTCVLGDGYSAASGSWTSLDELMIAEYGSNTAFKFPALAFYDVDRAWFVEDYDGSESYSRPYWTHFQSGADFINNVWREPVPFNLTSNYGLGMCYGSTYAWLTRPDAVYRVARSAGNVDLTDSVIEIKTELAKGKGECFVLLRNDDGRFDNIGVADDTYEHVKLGAEVRFSPGHYTTSGSSPEHSTGLRYWIEAFGYVSKGGKSYLSIYAEDGWSLLERWKVRRQFTWAAGDKNVFQLLDFIHARAGLEFAALGGSSTALTDLTPAFTINPGESGRTAVLKLLAMIPDVLFFRGEKGYLKYPQDSDSSDYTYGTDHVIFEAKYLTQYMETNRAQVTGDGVFTEDFNWTHIDLMFDIIGQDDDLTLDTTTRAHARGDVLLRAAEVGYQNGFLSVPMNCGQEVYDVVTITDQRAPLSAEKRRVIGINHHYLPARATYVVKLTLGAV